MKIIKKIGLVLACIFVLTSCDSEKEDKVSYGDFFPHLVDNMVLPALTNYQADMNALKITTDAFATDPSSTSLDDLQSAFKANYILWESVEVFNFGPAEDADVLLAQSFNSFPCKTEQVDLNIQNGNYNLESASNIFAVGLPALDYLLFGVGADNAEILEKYTTDLTASNSIQYVQDLVDLLNTKINLNVSKWPAARDAFISSTGTGNSSSLSITYNTYLSHYEKIKRDRFALPAGYATSFGIPIEKDPTATEGYHSGISHLLFQASIAASEKFFLGKGIGTTEIGFYHKLQEYNAQSTIVDGELHIAIEDQYSILKDKASEYTAPIEVQINTDTDVMAPFKTELQKMVPMIKSDMKSYLSVNITSFDNDGD
mgnify:CR=1 FL=1